MNEKELALTFLDGFINLEYKHKRAVINLYDDIENLLTEPDEALFYLKNNVSTAAANTFISALNNGFLNELVKKYSERDIIVITEESEDYPNRLYSLDFRPICLYAKGNVKLLNSKLAFSIVGSRKTNSAYLKVAENFSNQLANSGVTIVSGVANGGDKAAVKGAVTSGNIICVLASGFDFIDSEVNRDLIKNVAERGLVVTEYAPEIPPKNYHYPIRNRIIAGLSDGTLIVSGNFKSGARHTVDYALDYGKEVLAMPYGIGDVTGELCNSLIKDGARLTSQIEDITEIMGYDVGSVNNIVLNDKEQEIYDLIKQGVNSADLLAIKLNVKINELMPILTVLEIKGVTVKNNRNEYTAIR